MKFRQRQILIPLLVLLFSAMFAVGSALSNTSTVAAQDTPCAFAGDPASVVPLPTDPEAPPRLPGYVPGSSGAVALTFDGGADRGYAEDILDTLRDRGVPATFGVTGLWARANPDLVTRMAQDGHMVINHTYDHRSFTGLSDRLGGLSGDRRRAEVLDADIVIAPLIGYSTCPWYRLPYGDDDRSVSADMAAIGYTQKVGWTIDTLGWRGASTQDILSRSLRLAAPDAIYVMHVGRDSRDALALGSIIDNLRASGFGFATIQALESPPSQTAS